MKKNFLKEISQKIKEIDNNKIISAKKIILKKRKDNKIILAGNGASAAISGHVAVDFTKSAKIRAINFNEASLLTCFSNDYGYENWLNKALEFYSIPGDVLILISSSGNSKNIINAAKISTKLKLNLITLSGFSKKNKLQNKGTVNFHVDSNNYNVVESIHLIILLQIVESLILSKTKFKY
jgi:D-sedoheptulose 7-phosphate isomerase